MGSPPESKLDLLNLVFLKPQTTSVHLICCTYFYVSYLEFFFKSFTDPSGILFVLDRGLQHDNPPS